jgi:hypothetical protein
VSSILKVALRSLRADQVPGQRRRDKDLVKPINAPRGIDRAILKEHGQFMEDGHDEMVDPNKRDILPKDVFIPTPGQVGVRNLAETGKDLSKPIQKQIPKDKGYDAVRNLSQYLIETKGGGGADPVE